MGSDEEKMNASIPRFFLGGSPTLGSSGVVISKTTSNVLADVANRSLSHREKMRIGTVAEFAIEKIKRKLDAGKKPRNDGFFQSQQSALRSDAHEIFEGVLLKSKNEHEEKKIKILANIFANISFAPELKVGGANHVLQTVENLTYRQICLLSLFQQQSKMQDVILREDGYSKFQGSLSYETMSTLQEIYQLYNLGLLGCRLAPPGFSDDSADAYKALLGWDDVELKKMELTSLGEKYCALMDLDEVPQTDLDNVISLLANVDPSA